MGWASGVRLLEEVWGVVALYLHHPEDELAVARRLYKVFEDADCDTLSETEIPVFQVISFAQYWFEYPEEFETDRFEGGEWLEKLEMHFRYYGVPWPGDV